jgi:class II lanthipeptide synthase
MSSDFLDAADAIGRDIVAGAIWHGGSCTWVGATSDPKEAWQTEYRALAGSLYDGTAGVGLFLAELTTATGDIGAHRTAVGALRHAARHSPRRPGFHAGSLGTAWAVARSAALLDVDELRASARSLSARPAANGHADVVLGTAGSTLAQLALAELLDRPALLEDAVSGGERLIALATITRHGWSWASPDRPGRRHLCGLSHGAGGVGWALLELWAATGDDRFRSAAEGAFAYERSWFDQASGTWPDLRIGGRRRGARGPASSTVGTWCHGEAGAALTRLRAATLLAPEPYEAEAATALDVTRRELEAALPHDIDDLTICHGAAGSADVLLTGGHDAIAMELGHAALERYGATGRWPCGLLGGTSPALFRGLAGIGWWYLRLHDPATPSPLGAPGVLTAAPTRE